MTPKEYRSFLKEKSTKDIFLALEKMKAKRRLLTRCSKEYKEVLRVEKMTVDEFNLRDENECMQVMMNHYFPLKNA